MTKSEIKTLLKVVESTLTESRQYWEGKEQSHAFIVGYLQGGLIQIQRELESKIKK